MRRWITDQCRGAARRLVTALMIVSTTVGAVWATNNYNATVPGSGTSFAALAISAVLYPLTIVCDATVGITQCQSVNSSGQASVLEANSAAILSAIQSSIPSGTNVVGYNSNDPCSQAIKLTADFESTSSGGSINALDGTKGIASAAEAMGAHTRLMANGCPNSDLSGVATFLDAEMIRGSLLSSFTPTIPTICCSRARFPRCISTCPTIPARCAFRRAR